MKLTLVVIGSPCTADETVKEITVDKLEFDSTNSKDTELLEEYLDDDESLDDEDTFVSCAYKCAQETADEFNQRMWQSIILSAVQIEQLKAKL